MARKFYCEVAGQLLGPLEAADLLRMAKAGEISPADKIRDGESGKWTEAGKVKGLFEQSHSAAEPKPAPAPAVPVVIRQKPQAAVPALTPEVVHSTDDAVASWIGPAQPPLPQPSPANNWQSFSHDVSQPAQSQLMPAAPYPPVAMPVSAPPVAAPVDFDYPCPFCGEPIKRQAKKCKHCGEFLDPVLRASQSAPQHQGGVNVNVSNVVQVGGSKQQVWSPGVAVLLSLIIPGLGQMYKGQVISGVVWFFIVGLGYLFLIVPGLVLHLCCLIGASMDDPCERPRGI